MNTATQMSGKNILLVEDDPAVRQSIKLLLGIDRHQVTEAANGRQALQLFTGSRYDLVITDFLMPEMRGDELAQNLKNLAPSLPILMVTAYLEKLVDAGKPADAVLAKPFTLDDLRQAMTRRFNPATSLDVAAGRVPDESVRRKPPVARSPSPEPDRPAVELTPRDAREHVDSGTLTLWVQAQVESLDGCAASPRNSSTVGNSSTVEMLQLLTFAYACNVLASDEIRLACGGEPAFRYLCNGSPPFASEIAAFRRRYRPQLELTLARTLAKVATRGVDETSGCAGTNFLKVARQRLDIARHFDTSN